MRAYEYRHIVGFEETNLVGNVYYVNHLSWQGRCREMFLRDKAPELLEDLKHGLALVTTRCSCEYFGELEAFDEVLIRMQLLDLTQNQVTMGFEYFLVSPEGKQELIARGEQGVACMRRSEQGFDPAPFPDGLREAWKPYLG